MNINFDLNILKNKFEEIYHKDKSKLQITPFRDWATIFVSMFALLLVVFSIAGYQYVNLYNESMTPAVVDKKTSSGEDDLKNEFGQTLAVFEEKTKIHNEFLNGGAKFFLDAMNNGVKRTASTTIDVVPDGEATTSTSTNNTGN
jgi:hypothetical protein